VVDVVVRIDHGSDRQVAPYMLTEELEAGARRLDRDQHVEHDPASLAAHERHLRQVEPADELWSSLGDGADQAAR